MFRGRPLLFKAQSICNQGYCTKDEEWTKLYGYAAETESGMTRPIRWTTAWLLLVILCASIFGCSSDCHQATTSNENIFSSRLLVKNGAAENLTGSNLASNETSTVASSMETHVLSNVTQEAMILEADRTDAVLFPSFCITIGSLVYFVLTRVKILSRCLPYTGAMFLIGALMGVGTTLLANKDNRLHISVQMWTNIDSEVLLLVFLPGLIYNDSVGLNVHLFRVALWQNIVFAFPLVLAGTVLTALFAYYVFPYGWSFNLCMTFGSILSATDPVAVAALMNELGAPARLKVHINGEALLNDGSAIVFYSIFVLRYLYEFGVAGVGEDVGWAEGVALFARKAFGGAAIGFLMGFAILFMLRILNHRFSREENVTEVAAVLGLVYVGYFCADYAASTSGVIATVAAGLTVKFLGRALVNDEKLFEDFWILLEHLLNTVLFSLGGVVWGNILTENLTFKQREWAYLIFLYVILAIIRSALFIAIYPLTRRVGLGTCWQETVFQVHAGLRGAVGIALALALHNQVEHISIGGEVDPVYEQQARTVFGFVGGIALMTLVINAPTSKPLLTSLKLSESSVTRHKIIEGYQSRMRHHALKEMIHLLSQPRFKYVNYTIIKYHISYLSDLTTTRLLEAIERHRTTTPDNEYVAPFLDGILPHLIDDQSDLECSIEDLVTDLASFSERKITVQPVQTAVKTELNDTRELRILFLEILRSAYEKQVSDGELVKRQFLTVALEQSVDLALEDVVQGNPLNDWNYVNLVDPALIRLNQRIKASPVLSHFFKRAHPNLYGKWKRASKRLNVERAMAFMAAHHYGQEIFRSEFEDVNNELSDAGQAVISESIIQVQKAEAILCQQDPADVESTVSHKFCAILLNSSVLYVAELANRGLLKEEEAERWVHEIEKELHGVNQCFRRHGNNSCDCTSHNSTSHHTSSFHWGKAVGDS